MFHVRQGTGNDAQHVIDIDIKCYDEPWSPEYWRVAGLDFIINVVTYYGTPVGMSVFTSAEEADGPKFVSLLKVAGKPMFRKKGLSRMLLEPMDKYAEQIKAESIWATIPESLCSGEHSIAGWALKVGFKATAIQKNYYAVLGDLEDGYIFRKPVRAT